jgi:hypothetical protein
MRWLNCRQPRRNCAGDWKELVTLDAVAYGKVAVAMKLPHGDETETETRRQVLQAALKEAAEIPLEVAETTLEVARLSLQLPRREMLTACRMRAWLFYWPTLLRSLRPSM